MIFVPVTGQDKIRQDKTSQEKRREEPRKEEKIEIEMGAAVVVEPDEGASRDASWGNMRPYVPAVEFFAEDEPPNRPGGPGPRTWEV